MGRVKKILIFIGKPGYWLFLLASKIISLIVRTRPKIPRQIPLPFRRRKINRKNLALILIIVGLVLGIVGIIISLFQDLPQPNQLVDRQPILTTKIFDRNGILLYKIYRNENRTLVPLEKIPDHFIKATLAIEDKDFFNHNGLSWRGIIRAIHHNFLYPNKPPIGGSTITQQLIKNTLLSPEKTWRRKIQEAVLSVLVEKQFSKDEILQMYFNEVPYGGTTYGAEEASQKYFGKHAWEISPAESALLAGLTRAPTKYSPYGAHPEKAKQRQRQVVNEMKKADFISVSEAKEISNAPLRFTLKKNSIKAPHFVFYVKDWLINKFSQSLVEQGGLKVTTTLDLSTQQMAQKIVKQEIDKLSGLNVSNGASLIVKPDQGQILAMVGSKDYFDYKNDGNVNVTIRPRQPGSAIKAVNYAVALSKGYTPATVLSDTSITYYVPGQKPYSPINYDGQFHGQLPLRVALASSLNVPAVKVLSSYGVNQMIDMGQKLGITTWEDRNRFGLSLTLGGGEVKMIDLARVYSTLANLGSKVNFSPVLEVENHQGKIIYQHNCLEKNNCLAKTVLNPGIAYILNDVLADDQARELAFGPNSLLKIPNHQVAVKTGTTNNLRDNWCLGYTPDVLVGAWVGNNDNSPMSRVASGITGATPIWHKTMTKILENLSSKKWQKPENVVYVRVCQLSGTLPCPGCPKVNGEYFLKGTEPTKHCSFEKVNSEQSASKVD